LIAVVSDTSPIRALSHLHRLDLPALFENVLVPPAVAHELENPKTRLPPLGKIYLPYVEIRAPQDQKRVEFFCHTLDRGESEAITLALEIGAAAILIDEKAARQEAQKVGLLPVGVLGILIQAKQQGLIDFLRPMMDKLETEIQFFISKELRGKVLTLVKE
jgi:uncharacterized protein